MTTKSMEEEKIFCMNGGYVRQFIATFAVNLSSLSFGALIAWPSPGIKKLSFSRDEISWVASLMPLGAVLSPWLAGPMADRLGRRATLLLNDAPFLVGWAMLTAGQHSLPLLYTSRFMLGFAAGVVLTVVPIYVAEISTPRIRGALSSMFAVYIALGNLLVKSSGPFMGYIEFGILCASTSLLHVLLFFWMPESPYQMMRRGDEEGTQRALKVLRSKEQNLTGEMADIRGDIERAKTNSKLGLRELFTQRANLKALYLSLGLMVGLQLCGINAVMFYTEPIFDMASGHVSGSLSAIIIAIVMVLSSLIATLVVDKQGRRPILLISTSLVCITDLTLGVYFILESQDFDLEKYCWVPLASLILYIIGFSLGLGPVTWTIVGELFSHETKRVGVPSASSFCSLLIFCTTKCFMLVVEAWGPYTAFFIFAVFSAASVLFVLFILPETKGKTFEEIQTILNT